MTTHGIYIIKDEFFKLMNEPYLKGNKNESRPHYYCLKGEDEFYWMIPLSSRVDKYKKIIAKYKKNKRDCDILYVTELTHHRESAFLIQDVFPITEEFIEREYIIDGSPLCVTDEKDIRIILQKANRVIKLRQNGVKFTSTQANIEKMKEKLMKTKEFVSIP